MNKKRGLLRRIAKLRYSDMEPFVLNFFLLFYIFYEYIGAQFSILSNINLTPALVVVVIKLLLNKIDRINGNGDGRVGYLTNVIEECMKKKIRCEKLRIFSYDSQGFYHAIMGQDFYAEQILVLMHAEASEDNREIISRWNNLISKKKASKVTIRIHKYDRIIYGMTFDSSVGVFGSFKPECIVNHDILASTQNTYSCTENGGEVSRQMIQDFNNMFDKISDAAVCVSVMEG